MKHPTFVQALAALSLGLALALGASSCDRDVDRPSLPTDPGTSSRTAAPDEASRERTAIHKVARPDDDFQDSAETFTPRPTSPRRVDVDPREPRGSPRTKSEEREGEDAREVGELVLEGIIHDPERPRPGEPVTIHVKIRSALDSTAAVLHYDGGRGEESAPLEVEPLQPASAAEGASATRRYSARLPGFPATSLVRYWFSASAGGEVYRLPRRDAPTRTFGLYVEDPSRESTLPVYHLFLSRPALSTLNSDPFSDTYQRGDFVHDGKVYCDVGIRYRGQTSRRYPKRQWKIKFNPDQTFVSPTPSQSPIRSINLKSAYVDKIFIRETLGFELFRELGEPYCETEFIRTYLNGELLGLYLHVENPGSHYLKRNRLDEDGWLWKAYSEGHGEGRVRGRPSRFFGGSRESLLARPTRPGGIQRFELKAGDPARGAALLRAFLRNINQLQGDALERYLRENVDVDSLLNYLVACQLIHNADHVMKNYLVYADSEGRFAYLPWDLDLTHGRNYECGPGILNDVVRHDLWDDEFGDDALLYGTLVHPKCDGFWNALINAFLGRAESFRPLYYERLARYLERYYHPDVLIPKAERLRDRIREDVRLDRRRWGTYGGERDFDRRFERFLDWTARRYEHLRRKLAGLGYEVRR